jgi:hypothetical protein
MEMQQMFKQLLAGQAEMKADQVRMEGRLNAKMDSNQAKEAKQEEMLAEMSARLDAK